jgi:hypothetical protein
MKRRIFAQLTGGIGWGFAAAADYLHGGGGGWRGRGGGGTNSEQFCKSTFSFSAARGRRLPICLSQPSKEKSDTSCCSAAACCPAVTYCPARHVTQLLHAV